MSSLGRRELDILDEWSEVFGQQGPTYISQRVNYNQQDSTINSYGQNTNSGAETITDLEDIGQIAIKIKIIKRALRNSKLAEQILLKQQKILKESVTIEGQLRGKIQILQKEKVAYEERLRKMEKNLKQMPENNQNYKRKGEKNNIQIQQYLQKILDQNTQNQKKIDKLIRYMEGYIQKNKDLNKIRQDRIYLTETKIDTIFQASALDKQRNPNKVTKNTHQCSTATQDLQQQPASNSLHNRNQSLKQNLSLTKKDPYRLIISSSSQKSAEEQDEIKRQRQLSYNYFRNAISQKSRQELDELKRQRELILNSLLGNSKTKKMIK